MLVKIINEYDDEYGFKKLFYQTLKAESNEKSLSIGQLGNFVGQEEDATFCRDINAPENYVKFIKLAYEAGKRGEDLTFEEINSEDEEDLEEV